MIKQLRYRFIRIALISVTAVLIIFGVIINVANFISVNGSLNEMLSVIYNNKGRIPDLPHGNDSINKPPQNVGQFNKETPYTTRYFVLRFNDDGVLEQADLDKIASVTEDDTQKYLDIAVKKSSGYGYCDGYKYYVTNNGSGRNMAIFLDCRTEIRNITMLAMLSGISCVICIAIVYIAVVLFSRKAVDPVVRAAARQKQFITDAGHELKTPITVIATSLKVLEMDVGKQKWIDKATAQTERLTELVNSLVALSRMDEDESPLKFAKFNISDAVNETVKSFVDYADANGHKITADIVPDIIYNGDEYAVRQIVSVLIDNAVKYAAADTPIRILMKKERKGVIIQTANECDGIEEDDLNRLFDRFYRADKSRNAKTGGFGIGLSLVRSIAEGHSGSVCADKSGNNITFTVKLK